MRTTFLLGALTAAWLVAGCGGGGTGNSAGVLSGPGSASPASLSVRVTQAAPGSSSTSSLPFDASSVVITVLNSSGQTVATQTVTPSAGGTTATFTGLAPGNYTVEVEALSAQGVVITQTASPATVAAGTTASANLAFEFSPERLYSTSSDGNSVVVDELDPVTGAVQAEPQLTVNAPGAFTSVVDRTGHFLYVVDSAGHAATSGQIAEILVYTINADGSLTAQPSENIFLPGAGDFPKITANNGFLYLLVDEAAPPQTSEVLGFAINPSTGALAPVPGATVALNSQGTEISLDASGASLVVLDNLGGQISSLTFAIQSNGSLSPVGEPQPLTGETVLNSTEPVIDGGVALYAPFNNSLFFATVNSADTLTSAGQTITAGGVTNELTLDPTGHFLLGTDITNNTIDIYSLSSNGTPTLKASVPTGTNPGIVRFDPTGQVAVVAIKGAQPQQNGQLQTFLWNSSTGTLTPVTTLQTGAGTRTDDVQIVAAAGPPPTPAPTPAPPSGTLTFLGEVLAAPNSGGGVVITPNGKFIYADGNPIIGYAVNADGTINGTVPVASVADANGPNGMKMDPQGQFLYVADQNTAQVRAFAIGSDGSLTEISGSPVNCSSILPQANFLEPDPSGKFLFASSGDGLTANLAEMQINRAVPSIALLSTPVTVGRGPFTLVFSPTTGDMYVPNLNDQTFSILSLASNGNTESLFTTPAVGRGATCVITPDGRFLYEGQGTGDVQGYAIQANGNVAAFGGTVNSGGSQIQNLAIDPTGRFVASANLENNSIGMFTIGATGDLSVVSTGPFPSGAAPGFSTFDATGTHYYVNAITDGGIVEYSVAP